jgi:REP element-mobilizing transposase RayT
MNNQKHHRRSIRLKGYDYSQAGAYFITICTHNREYLFGEIVDDEMVLNDAGKIVRDEWLKTEKLRSNIKCDGFIVMPNHFHGILVITESRRGVLQYAPTTLQSPSQTIGAIVRGFKSTVTKQINQLRQTPGQKLWHRNYYEHIIRNENDYYRIYEYIENNPLKWEFDSLHPANVGETSFAQNGE